jgi:hypothetical protein
MVALNLQLRSSGNAAIIEDMLSWASLDKQAAVDQAITMLADLHINGHQSDYLKKLQNQPIWELKPHTRTGIKGGTRVCMYWRQDGSAAICGGEIKEGDKAGRPLVEAVRFFNADDAV